MISTTDAFFSNSYGPAASAAPSLTRPGKTLQTTTPPDSPALKKLRKAAGEFESLLLSNLWKSMKSSFADLEEDSQDAAHDTIQDMGIDAMCSAIGKAGGFGISKLILKHLEPTLAHSQSGNAPPFDKAFNPSADIPP